MSINRSKFNPGTLVILGILFGVFLVIPLCFAGGAVTLIPAEDGDVPQGSFIPKERIQRIEKKVRAHKAKMKGASTEQQQEQLPQKEKPEPEAPEKK